jgi:hypothetical protein
MKKPTTHMKKYEIQTRGPHARDWSSGGIGEPNQFDSVAEAEAAIEELKRLTGEGWRESEYRVVQVTE